MRNCEGCVRGFCWTNRAWYAEALGSPTEIVFGMYDDDGGTTGEMVMSWHELNGGQVPRLEVFSDAWGTLRQFMDVLDVLAEHDSEDITDEGLVDILKTCGFKDLTHYENPCQEPAPLRRRPAELEEEKQEILRQLGE